MPGPAGVGRLTPGVVAMLVGTPGPWDVVGVASTTFVALVAVVVALSAAVVVAVPGRVLVVAGATVVGVAATVVVVTERPWWWCRRPWSWWTAASWSTAGVEVVVTAGAQPGLVMGLLSRVTAPLRARRRPSTVVPVFTVIEVRAITVPTKVVPVPEVAGAADLPEDVAGIGAVDEGHDGAVEP